MVGIVGGTVRVSRLSSMSSSVAGGPACDDTMEGKVNESVMQPILLPGDGRKQVWVGILRQTPCCATALQRAAESNMIVHLHAPMAAR